MYIQRFLTLPTPNLSHPTASLSGLLCGPCGSQMSRFPIYLIWLKKIKNLVGHVDVPCLEDQSKSTNKYTRLREENMAKSFRAFAWFGGMKNNSWYQSHMPHTWWYRSCKVKAKQKHWETKYTGASKISRTFWRSYPTYLGLGSGSKLRTKFWLCNVHFSTQISVSRPSWRYCNTIEHTSRPRIFVGMLTSEAEPWTWVRFRLVPQGQREVDFK